MEELGEALGFDSVARPMGPFPLEDAFGMKIAGVTLLKSTRQHMYRIKIAAYDKCPACIHLTETEWHILSCPTRSIWRNNLLRTLGETLATHNTQLDLALIMLQGIQGALANPHFQMNPKNREPIFRALVNSPRTK